jgi:ATP-dependent DNA helicase RecG
MSLKLTDPVGFIKGATPSVRRAWESLGIKTIEDLLTTLPRRYDDFSQTVAIANTQNGDVVTIKGKVTQAKKMHTFRKNMSMTAVKLSDDTGTMTLTFFNQPWLLQEMVEGREIIVAGKVSLGRFGRQMTRPLWEPAEKATIAAGKIAPVYGLSGTLVQKTYRRLMRLALEQIEWPDDGLSEEWRSRYQLLAWQQAIKQAHEPESMDQTEKARKRLAFDELVTYQLALKSIMTETDAAGAFALPFDEQFAKKFVKELPFPLTDDQKIVAWKCINDMQLPKPMRRLIQGDVGSGKTVVAAFLAALVYRHGQSAALLAPTDILAKQHAETLIRFFAPFQIPLVLLTQKTKEYIHLGERKKLTLPDLDDVVKKGNQIIIGTHAIMVGSRLPKDLALAIVDEQHRFGVNQRETLAAFRRDDQKVPHFLSMTATPIPRSLALTLYGGLDVSLIHQKPSGRLPIKTTACPVVAHDTSALIVIKAARASVFAIATAAESTRRADKTASIVEAAAYSTGAVIGMLQTIDTLGAHLPPEMTTSLGHACIFVTALGRGVNLAADKLPKACDTLARTGQLGAPERPAGTPGPATH